MKHVFVHVVRSRHDRFWGIKHHLRAIPGQVVIDIALTPEQFDAVDAVEYSSKKFVRFAYYRSIFQDLTDRIGAAVGPCGHEPVNVYFADEGVWAVLWDDLRRRLRANVCAINVQHGFATLQMPRHLWMRRAFNRLSRWMTGYPFLGLGSLGGAGGDAFDLYLTYDAGTADVVRRRTGREAVSCPHLIQADLIYEFSTIPARPPGDTAKVLFALQPRVRGGLIRCDFRQILDSLAGLAEVLRQRNAILILRLHPGMSEKDARYTFLSHPISSAAELDVSSTLQNAMSEAVMVLSFYSTVLWDASLVGVLAVQVKSECCDPIDLPYEAEVLDLVSSDLESRVESLLAQAANSGSSAAAQLVEIEWQEVQPRLTGS